MKKLLVIPITAALVLALSGCAAQSGGSGISSTSSTSSQTTTTTGQEDATSGDTSSSSQNQQGQSDTSAVTEPDVTDDTTSGSNDDAVSTGDTDGTSSDTTEDFQDQQDSSGSSSGTTTGNTGDATPSDSDSESTPVVGTDPTPVTVETSTDKHGKDKWAKYSTDRYYNQLNDAEKLFYDNLYQEMLKYLETNATLPSNKVPLSSFGTEYSQYPHGTNNILIAFIYENPQFYFIDGWDGINVILFSDYLNGTYRSQQTARFKSVIEAQVKRVEAELTDLAKSKKANDIVRELSTYAYVAHQGSTAGIFLDGQATCGGYAKSYSLLMNATGVETVCLFGVSNTGGGHAWNQSKIDGVWYVVDPTNFGSYGYYTSLQAHNYTCSSLFTKNVTPNTFAIPLA